MANRQTLRPGLGVPGGGRRSEDVREIDKAIRGESQRGKGRRYEVCGRASQIKAATRARVLAHLVAAGALGLRPVLFAYSDFFLSPSDWYWFESLPNCAAT